VKKITVAIIALSAFLSACDSSPTHVSAVTRTYGPDDSDCSGVYSSADKITSCDNVAECPEATECSKNIYGNYERTEFICNSVESCDN